MKPIVPRGKDHLRFRERLICSKCGCKIRSYGYQKGVSKTMFQNNLCFDCAKWEEICNDKTGEIYIIQGDAYRVYPFVPKEERALNILGGDGKTKYILTTDQKIIKTNDVWKIGTVPWRFQDKLKNNAYFIPERIYRKLEKEVFDCRAIGCYDRYHCLRYNHQREYAQGPFNKVPKTWIVGNERCRSFINILHIPGYSEYLTINDLLEYEMDND